PVVAKVSTNTSTSGFLPDVVALIDAVKALLLKNITPPPASVKVVEESCVTCGGPHPYYQFLTTDGNAFLGYHDNIHAYVSAAGVNYNQGNAGHHPPTCEEYSQEVLGFSSNFNSGNPTLTFVAIVAKSSPSLTPFEGGDFNLEEIKDYPAKKNSGSTTIHVDVSLLEYDCFYSEGDICLLEKFLNNDPSSPLLSKEIKTIELKSKKSSIEEPPENKLKDLPSHLEYPFLEGTNKLPVIIAKNLIDEEMERLIKVLKSHKQAIAWKLFDIKGIDPQFYTHKILMDDDFKPAVQHQRRMDSQGIFKSRLTRKIKRRQLSLALVERLPIDEKMEVFIDDFSVFRDSFSSCLSHLDKMVKRCEETNLVLNWEKCHFMVKEGIVLGHKISKSRIEVDREKVDGISKLPPPKSVKTIQSFLGHVREAFETLKKKLIEVPILVNPDWDLPFEIMCDASDFAVGADAKPRLLRWILFLQEFEVIIRDKKGAKKVAVDHLSRLENPHQSNPEKKEITETFPLETLAMVTFRGENHASWSNKFEDALWSFRTAFKKPIGCTPYKLVYGKACQLPIKLEHKAYRALKHYNFDLKTAGYHRKVQMNELNELLNHAYENSLIYKEKTKKIHDSKIRNRIFNVGDRVLLFNSRLKIFSGKLKTHWTGPFTINQVFPYGTVELSSTNGPNVKVNGHRLKHYFGGEIPPMVVPNF
nr:reverse transcriptase domain-containing protein [Tanacetum cinerariifolium]